MSPGRCKGGACRQGREACTENCGADDGDLPWQLGDLVAVAVMAITFILLLGSV